MYIAILNLLQDVVVVVLPMPILWGLQMARSRKVALSCIFGIGIVYGSQSDRSLEAPYQEMLTCFFAVGSVPLQSTASR